MAKVAAIPQDLRECTIAALAVELGESLDTMRYWQQVGMPCARPGGKGRGNAALYHLETVRAWVLERKAAARRSLATDTAMVRSFEQVLAESLNRAYADADPEKDRRVVSEFMAEAQKLRRRFGVEPLEVEDAPDLIKQMQRRLHFPKPAKVKP